MLWSNQPWTGESTFLQTPSLHPVTHHSTMAALKSVEKQKGLCSSGEHRVDMAPMRDGRQWLSQVSPSQSCCNSCAPPSPQHSSDTLWGSLCQVADALMQIWEEELQKVSLAKPIYKPNGCPRGMSVHAAADVLVSLQCWAGPLEDVQGLPLLLAWGKRCQLHFLRRSWLGLPPATGVCGPEQTASPYVLSQETVLRHFRAFLPHLETDDSHD